MASFYSNLSNRFQLRLDADVLSQDMSLNRSEVRFRLYLVSGWEMSYTSTRYLDVDGTRLYSSSTTVSTPGGNSSQLLYETTRTYTHDTNGQKSLPLNAYFMTSAVQYYTPQTALILSATMVLPDISRGSTVGEPFAGFYVDSATIPITLNKAVTSYRHTVILQVLNLQGGWTNVKTITGVDTTADFAPLTAVQQDTIYQTMPDATSRAVRFVVDTYNGSTLVGSTSRQGNVYVRDTIVPTIGGMDFYDTVASSRAIGAFVQGVSKIRTTLTGLSGIRFSTVVGTEIWHNGEQGDKNTSNPSTMQNPVILSGQVGVLGKVIDSRGRVGQRVEYIDVLPYSYPIIESVQAFRSDSAGQPDPLGTYLTALVKGRFSSLKVGGVEKNNVILRFKVGLKGQTPVTITTNTLTTPNFDHRFTMGTYPIANAYDIIVEAQDKFAIRPATAFIPRGTAPFVLGDEGVGVGTAPVDDRALTVGDKGFYHEDIPLTLINGTTGGTGVDQPKAKRIGNMVFITGYVIPNITGARIISTLPVGWRPIETEHFAGINLDNHTPLRFFIGTNGNVQIYGTSGQRFGISCAFLVS